MKKIFKWIAIVFGIMVLIGVIVDHEESDTSSNRESVSTSNSQTTQKKIYTTTARDLFDAYDENEVATDAELKNKVIRVSGTLQSIDKDFTNKVVLRLETSNPFLPASMELSSGQESRAASLRKGSAVTIECGSIMRLVGTPYGKRCALIN